MAKQPTRGTMLPFELADGTKVELTLNWGALQRLRAHDREVYKTASKVIMAGTDDILAMADVMYAAYLCGLYQSRGDAEERISRKDFTALLPDPFQTMKAFNDLMDPKGIAASGSR